MSALQIQNRVQKLTLASAFAGILLIAGCDAHQPATSQNDPCVVMNKEDIAKLRADAAATNSNSECTNCRIGAIPAGLQVAGMAPRRQGDLLLGFGPHFHGSSGRDEPHNLTGDCESPFVQSVYVHRSRRLSRL